MLKKTTVLFLSFCFLLVAAQAQDRYFTKTGNITFLSKAPMEDIEGKNKTVTAVLDTKSGAMQFSVQMKGFEFEKALMQQHFNANYVESDRYPEAVFKGAVANNAAVNYAKDGTYPVRVKGKLTLHNVTRDVDVPGTIKVGGGKVDAQAAFNILMSDYKIAIPSAVKEKVSNSIKITVDTKLDPLK
jgi:polyisoprenoid-binding protein YceI